MLLGDTDDSVFSGLAAHSSLSFTELKPLPPPPPPPPLQLLLLLLLLGLRPFGVILLQLWECFSLPESGEETKAEAPVGYEGDWSDASDKNTSPESLAGEMTF